MNENGELANNMSIQELQQYLGNGFAITEQSLMWSFRDTIRVFLALLRCIHNSAA
jgi:hypothetical protein